MRRFRKNPLNFDEYGNNGRPKESKDKESRKNKKTIVQEWRKKTPEGKKVDCSRIKGLDPKTLRK